MARLDINESNRARLRERAQNLENSCKAFDDSECVNFIEDIKSVLRPVIEQELREDPSLINTEGKTPEEAEEIRNNYIDRQLDDVDRLGLKGITGYDIHRRLIGVVRGWYLYNGMTVDEMLSNKKEDIDKRSELNKKFAEEFKLSPFKTVSEEELDGMEEADRQRYNEKLEERNKTINKNAKIILEMFKTAGSLEFAPPDLGDGFDEDRFFEEAEKNMLVGQIGIDVTQVMTKDPYNKDSLYLQLIGNERLTFVSGTAYTLPVSMMNNIASEVIKELKSEDCSNEKFNNNSDISNYKSWYENNNIGQLRGKTIAEIPLGIRKSTGFALKKPETVNVNDGADKNLKTVDPFFAIMSDEDLIREVSGVDFDKNDQEKINNALGKIIIDDKNLQGYTIKEAADKIKNALDMDSDSTVLRREDNAKFSIIESPYAYSATGRGFDNTGDKNPRTLREEARQAKYERDNNKSRSLFEATEKQIAVSDFDKTGVEFLKSVTGKEIDINSPQSVKKAMESIYINGHQAADVNHIEPKAENIDRMVDIIKNSLSVQNEDIVTIMRPNSIEPNPRPVIPETIYNRGEMSEDEAARALENKTMKSVEFVSHFRENMQKTCADAHNAFNKKLVDDDKLFFGGLLENGEEFTSDKIHNKFNKINYFRPTYMTRYNSRVPFAYGIMLSEGYTMDEILSDTQEIKDRKAEIGKEIYSRVSPTKGDRIKTPEEYNEDRVWAENIYEKMAKAYHTQKPVYIDFSDQKSITDNLTKSKIIGQIGMDISQIGQLTNDVMIDIEAKRELSLSASSFYCFRDFNNLRVSYITSQEYMDQDKVISDGTNLEKAYNCQTVIDNIDDIHKFFEGSIGARNNKALLNLYGIINSKNFNAETKEERKRFAEEGMDPERLDDNFKEILSKACEDAQEAVRITGTQEIQENIIRQIKPIDDIVIKDMNANITDYGISSKTLDKAHGKDVFSLFSSIGLSPNSDFYKYKYAASFIYINGIPSMEAFGLNENSSLADWEKAGDDIAGIIKKGFEGEFGNFVSIKGKDGKLNPLLVSEELYEPERVEKLSGFKKLVSSRSEIEANETAYNNYIEQKAEYDLKKERNYKYNKYAVDNANAINRVREEEARHQAEAQHHNENDANTINRAREEARRQTEAQNHNENEGNARNDANMVDYSVSFEKLAATRGKDVFSLLSSVSLSNDSSFDERKAAAESIYINGIPAMEVLGLNENSSAADWERAGQDIGNIIKSGLAGGISNYVSIKGNDGKLNPVLIGEGLHEPEEELHEPERVEKLSGFKKLVSSRSEIEENETAYNNYIKQKAEYDLKKERISLFDNYNRNAVNNANAINRVREEEARRQTGAQQTFAPNTPQQQNEQVVRRNLTDIMNTANQGRENTNNVQPALRRNEPTVSQPQLNNNGPEMH